MLAAAGPVGQAVAGVLLGDLDRRVLAGVTLEPFGRHSREQAGRRGGGNISQRRAAVAIDFPDANQILAAIGGHCQIDAAAVGQFEAINHIHIVKAALAGGIVHQNVGCDRLHQFAGEVIHAQAAILGAGNNQALAAIRGVHPDGRIVDVAIGIGGVGGFQIEANAGDRVGAAARSAGITVGGGVVIAAAGSHQKRANQRAENQFVHGGETQGGEARQFCRMSLKNDDDHVTFQ